MDTEQIIRRFCQDITAFKKGEINAVTLYEMAVGLGEESMIDTACEWLKENAHDYSFSNEGCDALLADFEADMKKLWEKIVRISHSQKTEKTMNGKQFEFIDLGLSSGRLWASENAEGYFTYDDAKEKFGELLPPPGAFQELWEECQWLWDVKQKGMQIVGPNGNSILIPASGYRGRTSGGLYYVGSSGHYWSAAAYGRDDAYSLYFLPGYVYPLDTGSRASEFSVRPSLNYAQG